MPVIGQDHSEGAAWAGHLPGQTTFEARMRYYQAQQTSLNNLGQYILGAEVLIETIYRIIFMYASREHIASLDLDTVASLFNQVLAERAPVDSETAREAHRGGFGATT